MSNLLWAAVLAAAFPAAPVPPPAVKPVGPPPTLSVTKVEGEQFQRC